MSDFDSRRRRPRPSRNCPRCLNAITGEHGMAQIRLFQVPAGEKATSVTSRSRHFCTACTLAIYDQITDIIDNPNRGEP